MVGDHSGDVTNDVEVQNDGALIAVHKVRDGRAAHLEEAEVDEVIANGVPLVIDSADGSPAPPQGTVVHP